MSLRTGRPLVTALVGRRVDWQRLIQGGRCAGVRWYGCVKVRWSV